jgi:hypothetical protein
MKLLSTALTLLGTFSLITAQYTNQSAPFSLQIVSTTATYNGQYLLACHEGAAIEALCPGGTENPQPFNFNYSGATVDQWTQGYLTWELRGGNFNVSSPMRFTYDATTNIAVPILQPDDVGQYVSFNSDDFLYVQGFDDRVWPRNTSYTVPYYRWYICETYFAYVYNTLAWGVGSALPDNPSCESVQIKRIWI